MLLSRYCGRRRQCHTDPDHRDYSRPPTQGRCFGAASSSSSREKKNVSECALLDHSLWNHCCNEEYLQFASAVVAAEAISPSPCMSANRTRANPRTQNSTQIHSVQRCFLPVLVVHITLMFVYSVNSPHRFDFNEISDNLKSLFITLCSEHCGCPQRADAVADFVTSQWEFWADGGPTLAGVLLSGLA